jgi:hypothetical protein
LRLGSEEEAGIVRWIFHQFVVEQNSDAAIARQLNQAKIANQHGRAWTDRMIHNILRNENYIGNIVYNRTSRRLGQKLVNNPVERWIRSEVVVDPLIDRSLFKRAQRIMEARYVSITEDEMLLRLRFLLRRKGKLNFNIIKGADGVPSPASYVKHFGSLRKAFELIGYTSPRDSDWIDSRRHWSEVLGTHATQVAEALTAAKHANVQVEQESASISVNGMIRIYFQIARQLRKRGQNHAPAWRVYCRKGPSGLLVVLRLDGPNRAIVDYLVLPTAKLTQRYLYVSARGDDHSAACIKTMADLIATLKSRFAPKRRRHD